MPVRHSCACASPCPAALNPSSCLVGLYLQTYKTEFWQVYIYIARLSSSRLACLACLAWPGIKLGEQTREARALQRQVRLFPRDPETAETLTRTARVAFIDRALLYI